jgi:hypothetical protein
LKVSSYFETVTGTANLNAHLRFDSEPESDSEASSLASIASARANASDRGPRSFRGHRGPGRILPPSHSLAGWQHVSPTTSRSDRAVSCRVPWPRPGPGPVYSLPGAGAAAGPAALATALALHWQSLSSAHCCRCSHSVTQSRCHPAVPLRSDVYRFTHACITRGHTQHSVHALPHPGQLPSYRRRAAGIAKAAGQSKKVLQCRGHAVCEGETTGTPHQTSRFQTPIRSSIPRHLWGEEAHRNDLLWVRMDDSTDLSGSSRSCP